MHCGPQLVTNAEQAQFIIAPFQLAAKVVEHGLKLLLEYFADFSSLSIVLLQKAAEVSRSHPQVILKSSDLI